MKHFTYIVKSRVWSVEGKGLLVGKLLAAALVLSTLNPTLSTASGPGSTTGELLKIPVSARAIGMGEAYVAMAEDSSALYWNPAGLSLARQKEITFMHSSLLESIHYEHMAFAAPGDNYSIGASASYLGYGSIAGFDNSGASIGDQTAYSMVLNGGLSTLIKNRLSLGVSASLLREKLASDSAGTVAANFGAIYLADHHPLQADYRFGFSVLNVGPGLKFVSERDPLPRKIKVGVAALHVKELPLNLTGDLTIPNDNDTYIGIGSEYWFKDLIALRLGYAGSNDEGKGLRTGVGMKLRDFLFDYAYGGFGDFGATHRLNVTWRFGDKLHQLKPEEKAILKEARAAQGKGDYAEAIMKMEELLQKNPNDDRVLKQMIAMHENMLKHELNEAVAQANKEESEIPDVGTYATGTLIPGQEKQVMDPNDPLNLGALPDIDNLDAPIASIPGAVSMPEVAPAAQAAPVQAPAAQAAPAPEQAIPSNMGGAGAAAPAPEQAVPANPASPVTESAVPDASDLLTHGTQNTATHSPVSAPVSSASPDNAAAPDAPLLNPSDFK